MKKNKKQFPADFYWGGAVAANQLEGAYLEGEKAGAWQTSIAFVMISI